MTTLETDIITAYSKYSGIFFILTQNKHSVTHDNPSSEHSVTGTWLSVTWDDVGLCEGASVTVCTVKVTLVPQRNVHFSGANNLLLAIHGLFYILLWVNF